MKNPAGNKKIKNNTTLKLKTFDQVFKKSIHSKEFQHARMKNRTKNPSGPYG
jgi:hypothetical protein